jgi:hypothetical protein
MNSIVSYISTNQALSFFKERFLPDLNYEQTKIMQIALAAIALSVILYVSIRSIQNRRVHLLNDARGAHPVQNLPQDDSPSVKAAVETPKVVVDVTQVEDDQLSDKMPIIVHTNTGQPLRFRVSPQDTIQSLKEQINKSPYSLAGPYGLVSPGAVIEDAKTFEELGIQANRTIYMVVMLPINASFQRQLN